MVKPLYPEVSVGQQSRASPCDLEEVKVGPQMAFEVCCLQNCTPVASFWAQQSHVYLWRPRTGLLGIVPSPQIPKLSVIIRFPLLLLLQELSFKRVGQASPPWSQNVWAETGSGPSSHSGNSALSRLLCFCFAQELEGLIQAIHNDDNKVSRIVSKPWWCSRTSP